MSIYSTTIMKSYRKMSQKIADDFRKDLILDGGLFQKERGSLYKVGLTNTDIEQFEMPIIVPVKDRSDIKYYVIIDTRPFERHNGVVTKPHEVEQLKERALIELALVNDPLERDGLRTTVAAVYSNWLRSVVRARYNINELQESILRVGLGFYSWFKMLPVETQRRHNADEIIMLFGRFITRDLRITPATSELLTNNPHFITMVEESIEEGELYLESFLDTLNAVIDSPAVSRSTGALIHLTSTGSWFGFSSALTVAAAIERPEMLIHPIYQSSRNSLYSKTAIGEAVMSLKQQRLKTDVLVRWVGSTIEDNGKVADSNANPYGW